MRRSLAIPILVLLALFALAAPALSCGRASASATDPIILLSAIRVGEVEEPAFDQPAALPQSLHLGYGYIRPKQIPDTYVDVILDENQIMASAESQVFYAYADQDADAAALISDLSTWLPQYTFLGVISWFDYADSDSHSTSAFAGLGTLFHIPPGAQVNYFKMTVSPFSFEKAIVDPFHPSAETVTAIQPQVTFGPYSVYRTVSEGPLASIEIWGTPPPGDANCDAAINSLDALVMLQHGAGLLDALSCAKAADVNADGTVDARDAQLVLQFNAGLIEEL